MTGLFASGCQSIGASAFVFPMNVQGWFPLGLTGLNPLLSKKLSKVFFSTTIWKHQFFGVQPSLWQKWSLWPVTSSVQSLSQVQLFVTHRLKHTRLPCPSPTTRACSNSCPLSQWCHPTISSSVVPFSSCLQSFLASGSFPMSQFFTSGGQSIGVSVSASVLPMNIQDLFPLGFTGWISLQSKDSQASSSAPQFESISSSWFSLLYGKSEVYDLWSVQLSCSVVSDSLWSLNCSKPGFPVH